MLVIEIVSFAIALWLGLYLVHRYWLNPSQKALIWTAGGLISYSIALMLTAISRYAPPPLSDLLQQQVALLLAPLFFWVGALWHLKDSIQTIRQTSKTGGNSATAIGLVILATLFFALGFGLILAPFALVPAGWLFIAICGDLVMLGVAVGLLDAFELGETLRSDFIRSALEAGVIAIIFGGQAGLAMIWVTGTSLPLVALLFGLVATALVLTVFGRFWQDGFDQLAFRQSPEVSQERKQLREISDGLSKASNLNEAWMLSADNTSKQTRIALSHLGNLPKLATNPLIHAPIIEKRLAEKGADTHTLMRATELKQLLVESIEQLKPEDSDVFKATKAWRHYNALYFPYVRGLRPYGRRSEMNGLSEVESAALEWFDREVPHRTLYNWQTAAAKIIASDLIEQNEGIVGRSVS